jgi:hypothetical protein
MMCVNSQQMPNMDAQGIPPGLNAQMSGVPQPQSIIGQAVPKPKKGK